MRVARIALMVALVGLLDPLGTASAGPIFSDNFDGENGGVGALNYGLSNWVVSDGTVDLIGNGFYDFLPGNGLYVDMDGSTGDAGKLESTHTFFFALGVQYTLSFDLAGNQRNASGEQVTAQVKAGTLVNQAFSLVQNAPFARYDLSFTGDGTLGTISFEGAGGDNIGMLLDNVALTAVPEPASFLLLGAGLVGLAARARRT